MAEPIDFPEADAVQDTDPPGQRGVMPLPVKTLDDRTVSCWKLSPEDIDELSHTGIIWLTTQIIDRGMIQAIEGEGKLQPIVSLTAIKEWALSSAAWEFEPSPEELIAQLRRELEAARDELSQLKAVQLPFGHNGPPDEYKMGLADLDIEEAVNSISALESEVEGDTHGAVDKHVVDQSAGKIENTIDKIKTWIAGRSVRW